MTHGATALALLAVLLAALLASGCTWYLPGIMPPVAYPAITPEPGAVLSSSPVYSFPFQDFEVRIAVPVDPAVYAGARSAEKTARIYDSATRDEEWRSGLYRAMVSDPAQEPLYDALVREFRAVRSARGLDSDAYLELITVFVQSLSYQDQDLQSPKYPIETYVDGQGDCDDKSLLLAALLAREGYDVALLHFFPEQHMAVGVGCGDEGYSGTGYAYTEATHVSLVGVVPDQLEGNITLVSEPFVTPIGTGNLTYTRCSETRAIQAELESLRVRIDALELDLAVRQQALAAERADLGALEERMERLRAAGDVAGYNSLVAGYNRNALLYNGRLEAFRRDAGEYSRLVDLYNTSIASLYNRAGIARALLAFSG